jgi:hypothetical protein
MGDSFLFKITIFFIQNSCAFYLGFRLLSMTYKVSKTIKFNNKTVLLNVVVV